MTRKANRIIRNSGMLEGTRDNSPERNYKYQDHKMSVSKQIFDGLSCESRSRFALWCSGEQTA